jgi:HPt (histidine-containing phosphotransfer) domain-containing protein
MFDAAAGVRAVGSRATWERLMRRFREVHAEDAVRLREALRAGDPVAARRIAHTLKGVSRMLGSTALHDMAESLEHRIGAGETGASLEAAIVGLDALLGTAVAGIGGELWAASAHDDGAGSAATPVQAERLQELLALLAKDNLRALELWRALAPSLSAALGAERLQPLEREIEAFDFPAARERLRALIDAQPRAEGD